MHLCLRDICDLKMRVADIKFYFKFSLLHILLSSEFDFNYNFKIFYTRKINNTEIGIQDFHLISVGAFPIAWLVFCNEVISFSRFHSRYLFR